MADLLENIARPAAITNNNTIVTQTENECNQIVLHCSRHNGNHEYIWLYRQGHKTIYGAFFQGCEVRRLENAYQNQNPVFNLQHGYAEYAVKLISISSYENRRAGSVEDPSCEIRISRYFIDNADPQRRIAEEELANNGILIPLRVFSNRNYYFFVSRFANNNDLLTHILKNNISHDTQRMKTYFRQIVQAVHFLHERGVFHGDLSPENFVVHIENDIERLFVIDFGQARIFNAENEEARHNVYGKLAYTAPEFLLDARHPNSDWRKNEVWALGIIFFMMLNGTFPEWCLYNENQGRVGLVRTSNRAFQAICRKERLRELLEKDGKEFTSAHDLLQQMLLEDPERRCTTGQILQHDWFFD